MSTSDRIDDADERIEESPASAARIGERLRRARESSGLSVEAIAAELRLTSTVIRQIENGKWEQLGVAVYARGYLNGFAKMVDADVSDAEAVLAQQEPVLPLTDLPRTPRPSKLPSLVSYAVATALVAIPVVFGIIMLLNYDPLADSTETSPARAVGASMTPRSGGESVAEAEPETVIEVPVVTSGFEAGSASGSGEEESDPVDDMESSGVDPEDVSSLEDGQQRNLSLNLREDAWIDIRSDSGERLEYGLKPAGSQINVVVKSGITARLGNADAIDASIDGERLNVMQYARQEVAVLQLGSDGGITRGE